MINVKSISFLLIQFVFILTLNAQSFKFENISSKEGLPSNEIFCFTQDANGFLWIGTDNGLCRYDGYDFVVYRHSQDNESSISSNVIRTIYEDSKGYLWIGTDGGGLNIFDPIKETFIQYKYNIENKTTIISNRIYSICEDKNGFIWIGSYGRGICNIDTKLIDENYENLAFQSVALGREENEENSQLEIFKLHVDRLNNLWVGTAGDGVYILPLASYYINREMYEVKHFKHNKNDNYSISGDVIRAIAEDKLGNMWIGTEFSGLNKYLSNQNQFIHYKYTKGDHSSLSSNSILSILEDVKGRLWIGSSGGGLMMFDKEEEEFLKYEESSSDVYSIKGNLINSIYEDRYGNIWLGMISTGINLISERKQGFEHFYQKLSQPKSLEGELVKSILRDSKDNLWVGTYGGGLNLYMNNGEFKHFLSSSIDSHSLSIDNVQKIYEDKAGRLWIGTDGGGLNLYDYDSQTFTNYQSKLSDSTSIGGNSVWSICENSNGDLWVGTYDGGLNKFDIERKIFTQYNYNPRDEGSISSNDIRVVMVDRLGILWVGTYGGGLNRMQREGSSFEVFKHLAEDSTSIGGNKITSIFESPTTGQLWIGTFGGGFSKLDRGLNTFESYTEKDGLANNMVKSIEEDKEGNLWVSTQKGISCFNPQNQQFINYTTNDGLQDDAFSLGSSFKEKDGTMYFGGANGFNKFNPDQITQDYQPVKVLITGLGIQNQEISPGVDLENVSILKTSLINLPKVDLPFKFNSFSLKFVGVDFTFQDKIEYAYQMVGNDEDWLIVDGNRRRALYSNLAEGRYFFKVKARIGNAPWSTPIVLPITIQPPWIRSKMAYVSYFLFFIVLVWVGRKIFLSRIEIRKQLKLERIESEKIKAINEFKLNFFTTISHEIRTPLTLIKGPVEALMVSERGNMKLQSSLNTIYNNTNRLLSLANQILDFQKYDSDKFDLQVSQVDIVQFIKDQTIYFGEIAESNQIKINVFSSVDCQMVYLDKVQMEKVFFNLISNAFKFTQSEGQINIYISADHEKVNVTVEDNGKGIPKNHIKYIFDRYYQVENNFKNNITSSGLGLAIAKEIVELHSGDIQVDSQLNEYTKFVVRIPLGMAHFEASDFKLVIVEEKPLKLSTLLPEDLYQEEALEDNSFTLLLIDDNQGILNFLKQIFSPRYKVLMADNPKEGIRVAFEEIPDLIILDLAMPDMGGIEVCKLLKENIQTSHVPILLLTAMESIANQVESFECGADAYITKPFDVGLLKTRVKSLIQLRQKLREQFRSNFKLEPSEIDIPSEDQQFLAEVMKIVDENISNQEFSVDELAKKVGLSRAVFYRKLPALTGYTPNNFIRIMRLKRAEQLLKHSKLSIKEISYEVGFSSPKYFSQKFKQEYGESPGKFAEI